MCCWDLDAASRNQMLSIVFVFIFVLRLMRDRRDTCTRSRSRPTIVQYLKRWLATALMMLNNNNNHRVLPTQCLMRSHTSPRARMAHSWFEPTKSTMLTRSDNAATRLQSKRSHLKHIFGRSAIDVSHVSLPRDEKIHPRRPMTFGFSNISNSFSSVFFFFFSFKFNCFFPLINW